MSTPSPVENPKDEITEPPVPSKRSPLAALTGTMLLAAALFSLAAIMAFASRGISSPLGWAFTVVAAINFGAFVYGGSRQARLPRDAGARQRSMLGINALTSSILVLALLIGVNYVAARRQKTFDLTKNRVNSLAQQTTDVLGKLTKPVRFTYIYVNSPFGGREPDPKVQSLLKTYQGVTDKVSIRFLDAAANPTEVRGLGLSSSFTGQPLLLLETDKPQPDGKNATLMAETSRQEVTVMEEQNITSALIKLQDPKPSTIYFLSGHGELRPSSAELSQAKAALEGQNYTLSTLSLLKKDASVPSDASAVFVVGPRADLAQGEIGALNKYLTGKGRLAIFLSPQNKPLPRLSGFLKTLGYNAEGGAVVDQRAYQQPTNVVADLGDPSRHALLRGVSADVLLPDCVPLTAVNPAPDGVTATPVFESSAQSGVAVGSDYKMAGPYVLAAAIEKGESRVFLSSNTLFLTSTLLDALGNRSFLLAGTNWVVGNDSLVSIPPKPQTTDTISMPDSTRRLAQSMAVLVFPALVLIVGTVVWWRRR